MTPNYCVSSYALNVGSGGRRHACIPTVEHKCEVVGPVQDSDEALASGPPLVKMHARQLHRVDTAIQLLASVLWG